MTKRTQQLLAAVVTAVALQVQPLHAADLHVRPGESLAAAVAHAAAGDRLLIERGRYAGPVRIDKPLTLQGVDRPTISGGLHGDTIRVTAPDVTLQGLIVSDSGDDLTAQNAGIYVEPGADRITIAQCQIAYNLFGLWIQGVKDAHIVDNIIAGKRDHPSAQRGNGIQLYNTWVRS